VTAIKERRRPYPTLMEDRRNVEMAIDLISRRAPAAKAYEAEGCRQRRPPKTPDSAIMIERYSEFAIGLDRIWALT